MKKITVFYESSYGYIAQWECEVIDLNKTNNYAKLAFSKQKRLGYPLAVSSLLIICDKKLPKIGVLDIQSAFDEHMRDVVREYCKGHIVEHWNGTWFYEKEEIERYNKTGSIFEQ